MLQRKEGEREKNVTKIQKKNLNFERSNNQQPRVLNRQESNPILNKFWPYSFAIKYSAISRGGRVG